MLLLIYIYIYIYNIHALSFSIISCAFSSSYFIRCHFCDKNGNKHIKFEQK